MTFLTATHWKLRIEPGKEQRSQWIHTFAVSTEPQYLSEPPHRLEPRIEIITPRGRNDMLHASPLEGNSFGGDLGRIHPQGIPARPQRNGEERGIRMVLSKAVNRRYDRVRFQADDLES